jgi:hypothetical protein
MRMALVIALAALAAAALWWATGASADDPPQTVQVIEIDATVDGLTALEWYQEAGRWHKAAKRWRNRERSLTTAIRFDPETSTAIGLACTIYGHCSTLWSKARCESKLYRYAKNRHSKAAGLFQFLSSTWSSTPFHGFSVFDPYANALAAGWMHTHGRGGEWVCQ